MEYKPIRSGVILEKIVPTDYIFGVSAIDNEIKCDSGDWTQFLPKNEKQRQGFESMCCTNFSSTSAIEILMTRLIELKLISVGNLKWLSDNGYLDDTGHINFSDRFDALISGTKLNEGNTLKAPADAKHKYGLIPEKLLPWTDNQVDYFNKSKITPTMYSLGKEFLTRFSINYEMVYRKDFVEALKVSPLATAVYAWDGNNNGVYYKVNNNINHAVPIIKKPDTWNIFDSYDPFIKKLANDFIFFDYGIRYIIRENTIDEEDVKKNMQIDEDILERLYRLIFHRPLDKNASGWVGQDIITVLEGLEKSGEWNFWHTIITFFKKMKPLFTLFGIFGKK